MLARLARVALLFAGLGLTLHLDDLLLAVLGLKDELLGAHLARPGPLLYQELLLAGLRGLNHELLASLGVSDDDVLATTALQELLQRSSNYSRYRSWSLTWSLTWSWRWSR